jgi:ribonuclease HII
MPPRNTPDRGPDLSLERQLCTHGVACIAGLDEAGRGAWAGPLMAAAVVLPLQQPEIARLLHGVRDSKLMTPGQRQHWAQEIERLAVATSVAQACVEEVEALGPLRATRLAMTRALAGLHPAPDHLLIDYLQLPEVSLPQTALPHGDAKVLSIAAASVLAKVARDRFMASLDSLYPAYLFSRHKGYGTALHRRALEELGPSPVHRRTYAPVARAAAQMR